MACFGVNAEAGNIEHCTFEIDADVLPRALKQTRVALFRKTIQSVPSSIRASYRNNWRAGQDKKENWVILMSVERRSRIRGIVVR